MNVSDDRDVDNDWDDYESDFEDAAVFAPVQSSSGREGKVVGTASKLDLKLVAGDCELKDVDGRLGLAATVSVFGALYVQQGVWVGEPDGSVSLLFH